MADFPEPRSFNGGPDDVYRHSSRRRGPDDIAACYFCGDDVAQTWGDGNGHVFCSRECSDKYADERFQTRDARRMHP